MAAKKAKVVKAPVVPVSNDEKNPYGEDANKVVFGNPKAASGVDMVHQASRRIGYFERQLQCFRQEIEELEDKLVAPKPATKDVNQIEALKRSLDLQKSLTKNAESETEGWRDLYDKAADQLHRAGLRCPLFEEEDCDFCQEAVEKSDECAAEAEAQK